MRRLGLAVIATSFLWLLWYGWATILPEAGLGFVVPWTALVIALFALDVRFVRSHVRDEPGRR